MCHAATTPRGHKTRYWKHALHKGLWSWCTQKILCYWRNQIKAAILLPKHQKSWNSFTAIASSWIAAWWIFSRCRLLPAVHQWEQLCAWNILSFKLTLVLATQWHKLMNSVQIQCDWILGRHQHSTLCSIIFLYQACASTFAVIVTEVLPNSTGTLTATKNLYKAWRHALL